MKCRIIMDLNVLNLLDKKKIIIILTNQIILILRSQLLLDIVHLIIN